MKLIALHRMAGCIVAAWLALLILSGCQAAERNGSVGDLPTSAPSMQPTEQAPDARPTQTQDAPPPTAVPPVETRPAATTLPQAVINAQNVMSLQEAGSVQAEAGAQVFAWVAETPNLALAQADAVAIYNLSGISATESVSATYPTLLTTAGEQKLVAWTEEDDIHVWNLEENRELEPVVESAQPVTGLALAPQDGALAYATSDNRLNTHSIESGEPQQSWVLPFWLTSLSYSPDGRQIAGVEAGSFRLHFFDAQTGAELRVLEWTDTASPVLYGVYFSPDWSRVAWAARGTVQIMDVAAGTAGPVLGHEDFINSVSWSPDGLLLATAAAGTVDGEFVPLVTVWDPVTGEEVARLAQPEPTLSLSFSPDGRGLATLYASGKIQLWTAGP